MGFTTEPHMVRVDFFKPSGKWYMTEALDMKDFWTSGPGNPTPIDAVANALARTERGVRLMEQFIVVVLEPYHEFGYPVVLVPGGAS